MLYSICYTGITPHTFKTKILPYPAGCSFILSTPIFVVVGKVLEVVHSRVGALRFLADSNVLILLFNLRLIVLSRLSSTVIVENLLLLLLLHLKIMKRFSCFVRCGTCYSNSNCRLLYV